MVNARLTWVLENEDLLNNVQCGFRKNHSTVDQLVRLETFIREAFANKQHVIAVFFDLEKAYDTTWKHGILQDLLDMGFKGRLPIFIQGFLANRLFVVKVGDTRSDFCEQEMGVPQGSILSPMLFNIKINNIVNAVKGSPLTSLFVDDFSLAVRGKSLHLVERQLQLYVNAVQNWVSNNGFKFSPSKTECIHFCDQRKVFPEPDIKLNGNSLKVVQEAKFLGLIFDRRLNFLAHIQNLKQSCLKALDILRVVGHTDWGADPKVLLRLYRSLVRSKLDYGCVVYGSAPKTYLKMLDTIHHQGLRIALGAFRTSPVQSLYVEAQEPSLALRRLKLTFNYLLKLKSLPNNPAFKCVFQYDFTDLFKDKPKKIPPLSVRMSDHLEQIKDDMDYITPYALTNIPLWSLNSPSVRLDLNKLKKSETDSAVFKQHFLELCADYPSHQRIFTDGSKDDLACSAAAILTCKFPKTAAVKLHNQCSVYTAELKAILLALSIVSNSSSKKFLICSDSLSSLSSIANLRLDHPLLTDITNMLYKLIDKGFDIVFVWVPGHVGIRGNEAADKAAKNAKSRSFVSKDLVYSDLKPKTNSYVKCLWQSEWDQCAGGKLYPIAPDVKESIYYATDNRRNEVVLCRLRIGHTYLTQSYLLKGEDPPLCSFCGDPTSVKHILLDCTVLAEERVKYYTSDSMKVLFRDVPPDHMFNFLRGTNLFFIL